jgi:hypothetical protein
MISSPYRVELSEVALFDLNDFTLGEINELLALFWSLQKMPQPPGVQLVSLPEAADGLAYIYDTSRYRIAYNIFQETFTVRIVAIFKKLSFN